MSTPEQNNNETVETNSERNLAIAFFLFIIGVISFYYLRPRRNREKVLEVARNIDKTAQKVSEGIVKTTPFAALGTGLLPLFFVKIFVVEKPEEQKED